MIEYISRNGAKVALAKMRSDYDFDYNAIVDKCINRLMQLPIYRQEQKVGKWDVYTDCEGKRTYYTCPFYKNKTNHFMYEPKYCDKCGARLKKEGEEE